MEISAPYIVESLKLSCTHDEWLGANKVYVVLPCTKLCPTLRMEVTP